jgi:hypothetical protein
MRCTSLDDDVLELVAQYCSVDDLRQMRIASRRFRLLLTSHAFRQLDIWFTQAWVDAISMRLTQLADRYSYLAGHIQHVVVHFTECSDRTCLHMRALQHTDMLSSRVGTQHRLLAPAYVPT